MSIFLALPLFAHTPGTVCSQWCHTTCCEANGSVWPAPRGAFAQGTGTLVLRDFKIECSGACDALALNATARWTALILDPVRHVSPPAPTSLTLQTLVLGIAHPTPRLPSGYIVSTEVDESYSLRVSSSAATISANSSIGALRGLATFIQLLVYEKDGTISLPNVGVSIDDKPRWPFRALKIDTSRHFLPVPILKAALDGMEAAKMNVFLWHAVDGNSFPLESATYPDLTTKGAYDAASVYTLADVADVVAYAQARGVRVVPELDIPGHQGVGYARPELVACPLLEGFGGNARALDVTKNATYEFLRQWLGEMVESFGDPQVNVYGDERSRRPAASASRCATRRQPWCRVHTACTRSLLRSTRATAPS